MEWNLIIWMISILINLMILGRVVYNNKQEINFVNWSGVAHLVVFSILLGPFMTTLFGIIYAVERYEG